jgi:hypothetical protein
MQFAKKELNECLLKFTASLLEHNANPAKTPIENVNLYYDEWLTNKGELNKFEEQLLNEYNTKHAIPRNEIEQEYDVFLAAREEVFNEWKKTKNVATLNELVKMNAPNTTMSDPIYTILSLPKNL